MIAQLLCVAVPGLTWAAAFYTDQLRTKAVNDYTS